MILLLWYFHFAGSSKPEKKVGIGEGDRENPISAAVDITQSSKSESPGQIDTTFLLSTTSSIYVVNKIGCHLNQCIS